MIVADASVILELLLNTPLAAQCREIVLAPGELVCVPHLLDLEVCQVLRRYVRAGELSPHRASAALADFDDLPLERYEHALLTSRIWQLRDSASAYDAAYIALAEGLGAPLVTCDERRARSHGHRAQVRVVGSEA